LPPSDDDEDEALLQKILGQDAGLFSGPKDFGLLYYRLRIWVKPIAMAARAGCNPLGHNGVAPLTDLIQMGRASDFGRLGCSLRKRHILYLH
jgi:hypothetical protein